MAEQEKGKEKEPGKISRREFLKDAGLVVGGATVGSMAILSACTTKEVTKTVEVPLDLTDYGGQPILPTSQGYLVVDQKKCASCQTCMLACSLVHEGVENTSLSRIQMVQNSFGEYPWDVSLNQCRQCVYPPCVEACPTNPKALHVDTANGNVRTVDQKLCIGCQACLAACPFKPHRPAWNPTPTNALGTKGVSAKCDLCADAPYWSQKGGPDGKQACVELCPMKAIRFTKVVPTQLESIGYDINMRTDTWAKLGITIAEC
jgi:protein NrfC